MLRSSSARQRGTTMAELLTAIVVLGFLLSFSVSLVLPVLSAPNKLQSKVDTLQSVTSGLYRLQRDIRTSDIGGDWACTSGVTPTCTQSYSSLTSTPVLAVVTALSSSNVFTYNTTTGSSTVGEPIWQGVMVYWVATSSSGGSNLNRAFVAFATPIQAPAMPTQTQVQTAVITALALSSAFVAVPHIGQLLVDFTSADHVIGLKLVTTGTEHGRTNETSYESDTYARN
jgi:hypothetical protein